MLLLGVKALEGKRTTPLPQIMKLLSWEGQVPVQSVHVVPSETQGDPHPSPTLSLKLWGSHCTPSQTLWASRVPEFLVQTALHLRAGPQGWPRADCWGAEGQSWVSALREAPFGAGGTQGGKNGGGPQKPLPEGAGAMSPLLEPSDQRPGRGLEQHVLWRQAS